MFRIRRIHDDVLPRDARAVAAVQAILRAQFSGVSESSIAELPAKLRDPLESRLRSILLVAEQRETVVGFAWFMIATDLAFAFLDFISAAKNMTGRGLGGVLYQRVREECRLLGAEHLFFECLPDDEERVSDPAYLAANRARLRFYERFGAVPIVGTEYESPVRPTDTDLPHLVVDDLGSGSPLTRDRAQVIVRAILERKYGWLCPPEYVERVARSFRDDPVRLRAPRYAKNKPAADPQLRKPKLPDDARILVVVNHGHDIHHVRERGYVEAPARIAVIERELDKLGDMIEKAPARRFADRHVLAVHDAGFVSYLQKVCAALPENESVYPYVFPIRNQTRPPADLPTRAGYFCIDTFTPLHRNAWPAARAAVDCSLTCAEALSAGRRLAYALVRPPGHHAERRVFGGFCYLATAAIAANYLSEQGRVAILDVDYHHGNGQQDIFYSRSDVLTVSIHGHPRFAYPYFSGFEDERGEGAGLGANINLPLPEHVDGAAYSKHLAKALASIREFAPRNLVVCLGLDTAERDPTGSFSLRGDDFERNGEMIGALGLPTLLVQEGGYDTRVLGSNARRFVAGLWRGAFPRAAL